MSWGAALAGAAGFCVAAGTDNHGTAGTGQELVDGRGSVCRIRTAVPTGDCRAGCGHSRGGSICPRLEDDRLGIHVRSDVVHNNQNLADGKYYNGATYREGLEARDVHALDLPFLGLVLEVVDADEGVARDDLDEQYGQMTIGEILDRYGRGSSPGASA